MTQEFNQPDFSYVDVFNSSFVPIWIEDITSLYTKFAELKKSGVEDLRSYLEEYPDEVPLLAAEIEVLAVNEATVKMFKANSSNEFMGDLGRMMGVLDQDKFVTALVAFWDQDEVLSTEATLFTLDNHPIEVLASVRIPKFDSDQLIVPVTVTDITALREQQRALNSALEEIKTLQGIVPICSSCKMIRDDEGYWNQIEEYITEHTGAQFSHGICPECSKRLYPELEE